MKLQSNILTGAVVSSVLAISALAQSGGSLPSSRPNDFTTVSKTAADGTSNSVFIANHIGLNSTPTNSTFGAVGAINFAPGSPMAEQLAGRTSAPPVPLTARQSQVLEIETQIVTNNDSMAATRNALPVLTAQGQAQLNSANSEVQTKQATLRQSIDNGSNTKLASDFADYSAAVARVEVVASAQR